MNIAIDKTAAGKASLQQLSIAVTPKQPHSGPGLPLAVDYKTGCLTERDATPRHSDERAQERLIRLFIGEDVYNCQAEEGRAADDSREKNGKTMNREQIGLFRCITVRAYAIFVD